MKLDFWFLLIIALIFCASILTAWMLSEHFRLEKERMEQEAVDTIHAYDISERIEIPKNKVAEREFYWPGGPGCCEFRRGEFKCMEGLVC